MAMAATTERGDKFSLAHKLLPVASMPNEVTR